jgi:hypothetical protein
MEYSSMPGKEVNAARSSQKNTADNIKQMKFDCMTKSMQLVKNAPQYLTQAGMLTLQRSIGNRAVARMLGNGVVQRHLFIDAPDNDFRKLNDLGMWWAMACEWKGKTNELGTQISSDPHKYITSLLDIKGGVNNTEKDEEVRMIAHGCPTNNSWKTVAGEDIAVNRQIVKAEDKINEIDKEMKTKFGSFDKKKLTPMHCFMGNKGGTWDKLGRGGLGEGLLLIPNGKMKSIKTTVNGGIDFISKWTGGDFIDAKGCWIDVATAKNKLAKLTAYVDNKEDNTLLKEALEEVYTKVGSEYNKFAAACNVSGEFDNAWKL